MAMPKVISLFKQDHFETIFPEISITGKTTNLFIECISYDLQIPVSGLPTRNLDIFEETVLRMVRLKGAAIDELADILCLGKDLIWFVLNRLIEKELLDDSLALTNEGAEQLNLQSAQKAEVHQVQGRLFKLKQSGQILPYIHIGELQPEVVDEVTGKQIKLGFGGAGNYKIVTGLRLKNMDYESHQDSRIPTGQLREAIKRYNRLLALKNKEPIALCPDNSILSSRNEPVYFHIQAAVQSGAVDELLFSDGFVPNIDGMLDYVKINYKDVISEIQNRAILMDVTADGENVQRPVATKRYWQISQLYDNMIRHLPDKSYEDATPDERRKLDEGKRQVAIDCYHILESCLFYYLKEHPISESMMNTLKRQTASQNEQTVSFMAENLGMRNVESAKRLFSHLDGSRISAVFERASPHMYVCLPLAIVEAKESPESRVRILIQKAGNFLSFIQKLNNVTASLRHDADNTWEDYAMDAAFISEETIKIASILLPSLQFSEGHPAAADETDVSQARLLAQASLSKVFGPIRFQMMSDGLRNEWIKISPDKTGRNLPDMSEYAQILYRILQTVLANANQEFTRRAGITREAAMQRLSECYGKALPKSLSTVTDTFYSLAASGRKASLGAEALVYAANCEDLAILQKKDFVQLVDRVLVLRGHGNQNASLTENEESMGVVRDGVIELIKVIGG